MKVLLEPFRLLCSDVACPPPRVRIACSSLQHITVSFFSFLFLQIKNMLDHAGFLLLFLQQGTDQTTCNATLQVIAALPSFSPPFSNKRAQQDKETRTSYPFVLERQEKRVVGWGFKLKETKQKGKERKGCSNYMLIMRWWRGAIPGWISCWIELKWKDRTPSCQFVIDKCKHGIWMARFWLSQGIYRTQSFLINFFLSLSSLYTFFLFFF